MFFNLNELNIVVLNVSLFYVFFLEERERDLRRKHSKLKKILEFQEEVLINRILTRKTKELLTLAVSKLRSKENAISFAKKCPRRLKTDNLGATKYLKV